MFKYPPAVLHDPSDPESRFSPRPRALYLLAAGAVIAGCALLSIFSVAGLFFNPGSICCCVVLVPLFLLTARQQYCATFRSDSLDAVKVAEKMGLLVLVGVIFLLGFLAELIRTNERHFLTASALTFCLIVFCFVVRWINRQWAQFLWTFPGLTEEEQNRNASRADAAGKVPGPPLQFSLRFLFWLTLLLALLMSAAATLARLKSGGPPE
ncbi:MAG: hypothetical protein JXB10_00390 [Pirellulales bacterium]|nr:hypothetical protein [Pirellulales bacterium]